MQDFRDLLVWQKAHQLALETYRLTRNFPPDERFGLTSQLRRASASIAANLAEGCGRGSDADFARFVQNSMGSASETDYHFLLAKDLTFLDLPDYNAVFPKVVEVKRMLVGFLQVLHGVR